MQDKFTIKPNGNSVYPHLKTVGFYLFLFVAGLGFTALGTVTGMEVNSEIRQLLQVKGPVEIWQASLSHSPEMINASKESPLVRQARIYSNLLNPPEPPKPKTPVLAENETKTKETEIRPERSLPKFEVYVTSVYKNNPAKSIALISEPGSGFRWVRPGDKVGYLTVKEIQKEAVVCLDGDRIDSVVWECRIMEPDLPGLVRPNKSKAYAKNTSSPETSAKISRVSSPPSREQSNISPHPVQRKMQPLSPRSVPSTRLGTGGGR